MAVHCVSSTGPPDGRCQLPVSGALVADARQLPDEAPANPDVARGSPGCSACALAVNMRHNRQRPFQVKGPHDATCRLRGRFAVVPVGMRSSTTLEPKAIGGGRLILLLGLSLFSVMDRAGFGRAAGGGSVTDMLRSGLGCKAAPNMTVTAPICRHDGSLVGRHTVRKQVTHRPRCCCTAWQSVLSRWDGNAGTRPLQAAAAVRFSAIRCRAGRRGPRGPLGSPRKDRRQRPQRRRADPLGNVRRDGPPEGGTVQKMHARSVRAHDRVRWQRSCGSRWLRHLLRGPRSAALLGCAHRS